MLLATKKVVVIGGSSGIGEATARLALEHGADVAIRQLHIFADDFPRSFERLLDEEIRGEGVDIRRVDARQPVCNFGVPHVGKVGRFIFIRAAANTMPYGGRS